MRVFLHVPVLFLSVVPVGGEWRLGGHTIVFACACLYVVLYIVVFYIIVCLLFAAYRLYLSLSVCPNSFNSINLFEFVLLIGWVARSFGIRLTTRMFCINLLYSLIRWLGATRVF